jgi:CRP-like cAMP-binding protein
MSEPTLLEVLQHLWFLEGASEEDLRHIASVAQLAEYRVGQTLFRAGKRSSRIFLVVEGSVALKLPVPGRGNVRLYTVGSGELLGWSPLLRQLPMTATARALASSRVVAVDAGQILALCHHDSRFGFTFMQRMALALTRRLDATRLQLLDVYRHELPAGGDRGEATR